VDENLVSDIYIWGRDMSKTKDLLPDNYDELVDMWSEGLLTQDEFDQLLDALSPKRLETNPSTARVLKDEYLGRAENRWLKKPQYQRQEQDNWAGDPMEQELA